MEDKFKKLIEQRNRRLRCYKCGKILNVVDDKFICEKCDSVYYDQLDLIKAYLRENGSATAVEISRNLGVSMADINNFLRNGRVEVSNGSQRFIPCRGCGIEIRFGEYCPNCANKIKRKDKDLQVCMGEIVDKNSIEYGRYRNAKK